MQNPVKKPDQIKTVITGASSGIGKATALELAGRGYDLILTSRDHARLKSLKDEIKDTRNQSVHTFQCDVTQVNQVCDLVEFTRSLWSSVDVLFNNAGCGKYVSLENSTNTLWDETIGTVLSGTFYCCREFLPLLKAAPSALILNNASIAAQQGFAGFSVYSAAKGGVAAFSRSLRTELRTDNIRVTTLSSGATDTPFWKDIEGDWDRTKMMTSDTIAATIRHIIEMPPAAQVEEILIMPSCGPL